MSNWGKTPPRPRHRGGRSWKGVGGLLLLWPLAGLLAAAQEPAGLVLREFVFEEAPFPQCHASTLVESGQGLVAAWFGGTREGAEDVGIWTSRRSGGKWTVPTLVADGVQYVRTDGEPVRHPTWNPVLFRYPEGRLLLFWKCGRSPREWWGEFAESSDHGITWTHSRRLPEDIVGPVRNKPILLPSGTLLCGSSTEFDGWRVHFEGTADAGGAWWRTAPIAAGKTMGAIQPTLLRHADGSIQALCRNQDGSASILSTVSKDEGRTWSELAPIGLPNPNSGIDAVALEDGRFLLVYNHTQANTGSPRGRERLDVAVSKNGTDWQAALTLEQEPSAEFSYPAVIQRADGIVSITYTWKRRRIAHVELDPRALELRDFVEGAWPD